MTETKTYNGWTNYETWLVNLWFGNDQETESYWRERAQEAIAENTDDGQDDSEPVKDTLDQDQAVADLAKWMKDEIDDATETLDLKGFFADLMNAAVSEVNWREIAEHFVEDGK